MDKTHYYENVDLLKMEIAENSKTIDQLLKELNDLNVNFAFSEKAEV